jgi:hypothetical protein
MVENIDGIAHMVENFVTDEPLMEAGDDTFLTEY